MHHTLCVYILFLMQPCMIQLLHHHHMVSFPLGRSAITDSYSYLHCAILTRPSHFATSILFSIHTTQLSLHVALGLHLPLSLTVNHFLQYFPLMSFLSDDVTKTTSITAIKNTTAQITHMCV